MTEQAASPQLSISFVVTADHLVATNRIGEREGRPMLFAAALMLAVVAIVFWQVPVLGPVFTVLSLVAASPVVVPPLWRLWIARQAGSLIGEQRDFVVDEEGVHEVRTGIRHTLPWSSFTQLRIHRYLVVFSHDGRVVQVFPARAFASPGAVQQLIDLASAHAPQMRVDWDR